MLLFYGINSSKLKCFIDVVAKFFTNISTNIVKKKHNFFRFVQVYEFAVLSFYVLKKSVVLNCILLQGFVWETYVSDMKTVHKIRS